jgi:hypothetical protein
VVKAEARYEMTAKEVEHRIRDEIFAVIRAQEAAKEAAEARLAGKAVETARLKAIKATWEGKVG